MGRLLCALTGVPRANLCDANTYVARLRKAGFVEAAVVERLDNDVFLGFSNFVRKHKYRYDDMLRPSVMSSYSAAASMFAFVGRMHLLSFVIVTAVKPEKHRTNRPELAGGGSGARSIAPPRISRQV